MKRSLVKMAAALAMVIGGASFAKAAISDTVQIIMTVADLQVQRFNNDHSALNIASAVPGVSVVTPNTAFTNISAFTTETFDITIGATNPWVLVTDPNAAMTADQHRVYAVWRPNGTPPVVADFGGEDLINGPGGAHSSGTKFAVDGDNDNVKGFNVAAGGTRDIFFRVDLPPTVNVPTNTTTVTVTAALP